MRLLGIQKDNKDYNNRNYKELLDIKESELKDINKKLYDTARIVGKAEIATGVLHNVGNVLNSINLITTRLKSKSENSHIENLMKLADIIYNNRNVK